MKRFSIVYTLTLFVLVFGFFSSSAQTNERNEEADIQHLFDLISECRSDSLKIAYNATVEKKIRHLLNNDQSFDQPFDQIKNLGKVKSDDGKVRVYTWSFPLDDKTFRFGGFIQYKTKKNVVTTPLHCTVPYIPNATRNIAASSWYGSLYYKLIAVKKKRDTYYIALGWSGHDAASDFKVIEPMTFNKSGGLSFMGNDVFEDTKGNKTKLRRVILEYSQEGKVALDYDPNQKKIIFDHLSPIDPSYKGIYSYYGPDFTYDAYSLKKNVWTLEENIDARNQ